MKYLFAVAMLALLVSCNKSDEEFPPDDNDGDEVTMEFKFNFDENQERLNNLGVPAPIPDGNAAQTPDFKKLSVHLIELAPNQLTIPGQGEIAYKGAETTTGGENAIDFDQAIVADENVVFHTVPLKNLAPGTYEYIRVSVSYQLYDINFNIKNIQYIGEINQQKGTVASFLGFNSYITSVMPSELPLSVNANKKQGFWVFETRLDAPFDGFNQLFSGEAPAGLTTVVNPLAGIADIPVGSCIITGKFDEPLVIEEGATENIEVNLSFSINNSFEWVDNNENGELDFDAENPENIENIVDMGLRGLIPEWTKQ